MQLLSIYLNGKRRIESFDITNLGGHQIILGRRWLRKENPRIDWTTGKIHLRTKEALKTTITREEEATLPEHQLWDHEINLKEGAQLKTGPI